MPRKQSNKRSLRKSRGRDRPDDDPATIRKSRIVQAECPGPLDDPEEEGEDEDDTGAEFGA